MKIGTPADLDHELRQPGRILVFTDDTGPNVKIGHLRVLVSVPFPSDRYPDVCADLGSIRTTLGVETLHAKELRRGPVESMPARLSAYRDWCRCLRRHASFAAFTYLNDADENIKSERSKPSVRTAVPKQLLGSKAMLAAGHHKIVLAAVRNELLKAERVHTIVAVEDASKAQRGRVTSKRLADINADPPTDPPLILGDAIFKADDAEIDGLQLADLAAHSLMRLRGIVSRERSAPGSFAVDALDPFDRVFWEEVYRAGFDFENVHHIIEKADDIGAASPMTADTP